MTETSLHALLTLGVISALILLGLVLNGPYRRWKKKARAQDKVTCRACGHMGGAHHRV